MKRQSLHHPHPEWLSDSEHVVYRCFDTSGALLYVGFTVDLCTRLRDHHRPGREVGERTAYVTAETYSTRAAAHAAEVAAIKAEAPLLNIRHNHRSAA